MMIYKHLRIALFLLLLTPLYGEPLAVDIHGTSAVLLNGKSGKMLFSKEKDLLVFPASTTKVASVLYILEKYPTSLSEVALATQEALATITPQAKRESQYRSPPYWLESDGTHMSIKRGEELPMKDLLYASLIHSPNDAVNVMAAHVGKGIPQFMEGLNLYCKELGLSKTNFMNPHGLHHPMHRTTAEEMAILASRALTYPLFRDIVMRTNYTFPQTNLEHERVLPQSNRLIKRGTFHYSHAIGVKTGTTKAAGKCLLAAAEKEGRLLVAALYGYGKREELYGDATKLFEAAFAEKKKRVTFLTAGVHPFTAEVKGKKRKLLAEIPTGLHYDFYPSEKEQVVVHLELDEWQLPLEKGERMGQLVLKNRGGQVLGDLPLFTAKKIRRPFFAYSADLFSQKRFYYVIVSALIVVLLLSSFRKRSRRR